MLVKLKGLMKVKRILASGKTIYYCYAWRGGPLLRGKDGRPLHPHEPELVLAYEEAHDLRRNPRSNDLKMIVRDFRLSSDFQQKARSTRTEYDRYLDDIVRKFGALSLAELERKETRGAFKAWRDSLAGTPRTADYAWTTLARVLSFAKDRGIIAVNIAERGGRLYTADRTEKIWTAGHIAAFDAVACEEMRLAMMLALWTGQSQGDLLRATWSSYDGRTIKVKQGKTGARIIVPVAAAIRNVIDEVPRRAPTIMTNRAGRPWTEEGFRTSWRKTRLKARIEGLTFHDLRGTAVTRLALAGCTSAEIGALTGHSMRDVHLILDAHYLGGKLELAQQAIQKLEALIGE